MGLLNVVRFSKSKGRKFNYEKDDAKESNYVLLLDAINFKYSIPLMVPDKTHMKRTHK